MATGTVAATLRRHSSTEMPRVTEPLSRLDPCDGRDGELQATFAWVREEFPTQAHTEFRVIVQGVPRSLEPAIQDEVCLIGHEALSNAFRHAHASSIEVELEYAANYLRVLVRDDGGGIDPRIADSGRDGCWGLWAMRERAKGIGARLKVLSRMAAGTEVELLLPGAIAFGARESVGARWFSKLYS
jgi:signal transduction histidine kinase